MEELKNHTRNRKTLYSIDKTVLFIIAQIDLMSLVTIYSFVSTALLLNQGTKNLPHLGVHQSRDAIFSSFRLPPIEGRRFL